MTNPKYCDIDSTFGLHDYQITVDIRSSTQSYFCEVFRKVFTKDIHSGYAHFILVESDDSTKKFQSSTMKLQTNKIEYEWKSMITNGSVKNMAMLELCVQDEFGENFHYATLPVLIL